MAEKQDALGDLVADAQAAMARATKPAKKARARRADATGQKPDYHAATATVAARVPVELAAVIREKAAAEGLSVNAWLGRLLAEMFG